MNFTDSRYSLHAMFKLLSALSVTECISLHDITHKTGYSISTLEVAAAGLRRCKMVSTKRGPNGGFMLVKPLNELKVKDLKPFIDVQKPVIKRALEYAFEVTIEEFVSTFK